MSLRPTKHANAMRAGEHVAAHAVKIVLELPKYNCGLEADTDNDNDHWARTID